MSTWLRVLEAKMQNKNNSGFISSVKSLRRDWESSGFESKVLSNGFINESWVYKNKRFDKEHVKPHRASKTKKFNEIAVAIRL